MNPSYDEQLDGLYADIRRGKLNVSRDVLRRAYRENLHRVPPEVETLFGLHKGKTVITADHGELLGNRC